jgi:HPt (histidine-containing phosphotransfer) domain-containing protein
VLQADSYSAAMTSAAMTAGGADDQVLDRRVLNRLVDRLGDAGPAFRASLLETWSTEAAERREELRLAVAADDPRRVLQVAHALRSGSGAIGARELAMVCARVEDALREGAEVDLAAARADVDAALDRAIAALQA